mmetsp:Transcript_10792/g.22645  ORF Transcript_10792/g.22645 Transcript_10792/m.22645 type:complete len:266 (-) Transcript_10792:135-932(-)
MSGAQLGPRCLAIHSKGPQCHTRGKPGKIFPNCGAPVHTYSCNDCRAQKVAYCKHCKHYHIHSNASKFGRLITQCESAMNASAPPPPPPPASPTVRHQPVALGEASDATAPAPPASPISSSSSSSFTSSKAEDAAAAASDPPPGPLTPGQTPMAKFHEVTPDDVAAGRGSDECPMDSYGLPVMPSGLFDERDDPHSGLFDEGDDMQCFEAISPSSSPLLSYLSPLFSHNPTMTPSTDHVGLSNGAPDTHGGSHDTTDVDFRDPLY